LYEPLVKVTKLDELAIMAKQMIHTTKPQCILLQILYYINLKTQNWVQMKRLSD